MTAKPIKLDLGPEADDRLPKCPVITPEEQAAIDAEQRKRADRFDLSPTARHLMRARAIVAELDNIPTADMSKRQRSNYATALAALGRYKEAYDLTQEPSYLEIAEAIDGSTNGSTECACSDFNTVEMRDGVVTEVSYSRIYKKRDIYSIVHGKLMALMACNKCGNLTLRER